MKIEDLFENMLIEKLSNEEFEIKKNESGYLAIKKYMLGEKVIFFEISKKTKVNFHVRLNLWLTNLPVQKIHSLVNERIASAPIFSYPLSYLSKKIGKEDANFERKKFNGILGNIISEETISQYLKNLHECLKTLIIPFFEIFTDQEAFNEWLNQPILNGSYDFEREPVWKDAITSLIVAKLVNSNYFEQILNIWISKDLPNSQNLNTKDEIERLSDILKKDIELL